MTETIPESHIALLTGPNLASFVTVMPDGMPQVNPVWVDYDGEFVRVNTAKGRQKWKNMLEHPKVALLIIDPNDDYHYLEIRGEVVNMSEEGGVAHIDSLSRTYENMPFYGGYTSAERQHTETRIIAYIKPTRIRAVG